MWGENATCSRYCCHRYDHQSRCFPRGASLFHNLATLGDWSFVQTDSWAVRDQINTTPGKITTSQCMNLFFVMELVLASGRACLARLWHQSSTRQIAGCWSGDDHGCVAWKRQWWDSKSHQTWMFMLKATFKGALTSSPEILLGALLHPDAPN